MDNILISTLVLVVGLTVLGLVPRDRLVLKAACIAIAFGAFTAALIRQSGSPITPNFAGQEGWRVTWAQLLEAFWWLAGARLVIGLMHAWVGTERKVGNSRLATDIIAGAIYVFAVLAITNDVLQIPIRGLLATSGVIAIVLGLALQSTLSDVFSGISINLEQPFQPGDTIQLDGVIEGTVTQVNWRATHILTGTDDIAVIPNSIVAKARIINRSRPATRRGSSLVVTLDGRIPTTQAAQTLLEAALTAAKPLRDPPPTVQCTALHGYGVDYEVFFHVRSDTEMGAARTELIRLIHRTLAWADIPIARTDGTPPPLPDSSDVAGGALRKLRLIGLFDSLSPAEIGSMISKVSKRSLAVGDVAIAQGMQGDGLFVIESGVLEVTQELGGHTVTMGRLGPGDHFGETSLLAGEPSGATATAITPATLRVVCKADLAPLMHARPALMEEFSRYVDSERRRYEGHVSAAFHTSTAEVTDEALLHRIERFFRAPLGTG